MADRINQKLLKALQDALDLSRPAVYARIGAISRREMLPNNLAAIRLGADAGLALARYASPAELQELRAAGSPVTPPPASAPSESAGSHRAKSTTKVRPKARRKNNEVERNVFVVHGRDEKARQDMFDFLRALGLRPIEWLEAIKMTRKPLPYVGQILDAAFANAQAVVVLMTPDDITYLRKDLQKSSDKAFEKRPTGQARPNVLFEAGLAFGTHPDRTILVELGDLREFSDVGGRHTVRMNGSSGARHSLASRLEYAGCRVNRDGQDWLTAGTFDDPLARAKTEERKRKTARRRVNPVVDPSSLKLYKAVNLRRNWPRS